MRLPMLLLMAIGTMSAQTLQLCSTNGSSAVLCGKQEKPPDEQDIMTKIARLGAKLGPLRMNNEWLEASIHNPTVRACEENKWPEDDAKCNAVARTVIHLLIEKYQPAPTK